MAVNLKAAQVVALLNGVVETSIANIKLERKIQQSKKEAEFQKAVASGMSYADQVRFRESQIEEEKNATFSDPEYMSSLEISLADTKKLARYEKINIKYTDLLTKYSTGKQSITKTIATLSEMLSSETDPSVASQLRDEIAKLQVTQSENEITAVMNRATAAERDLSLPLIAKSIKEVKSKRAEAALADNEDAIKAWDETLNALETKQTEITINKATNEMTYTSARQNLKPHQQVALINQMAEGADATKPIIFNGTEYASLKDYWGIQRDQVISSPQFWESLSGAIDDETSRIASQSVGGQVPISRIQEVDNFYKNLVHQTGFENYGDRIEQQRVATVDQYVNEIAVAVQNELAAKAQTGEAVSDDYRKAEETAIKLEQTFGIKIERTPIASETSFVDTTSKALAEANKPVQTPRVFTSKELSDLGAAEQRIAAGTASETDKKNVQYAKGQGYTSSPTVAQPIKTETPVAEKTTPIASPEPIKTVSIVDYLKGQGQDSSFAARQKLAAEKGIVNYTGSSQQNTDLLTKLQTP